jgi:soluble P-type ATPase
MPVIKCSNGKYRIGNGSCIYDTQEKATEVWQAILASGAYAAQKVSYDYDETLTTAKGMAKAKRDIAVGKTVYIISARGDKDAMVSRAKELNIPLSRVFATGSNKAKIQKIQSLNIKEHNDNNLDVLNQLKELGIKTFQFEETH